MDIDSMPASVRTAHADYEGMVEQYKEDDSKREGWSSRGVQWQRLELLTSDPNFRMLGRVLDVGCGRGELAKGTTGMRTYTGVDFIKDHIDYCTAEFPSTNHTFHHAEAAQWLGEQTEKWDTVLASGLLAHHTPKTVRDILTRMWYVTDVDGYMAFNINRGTTSLRLTDILNILRDVGVDHYTIRHDYDLYDTTVYCYPISTPTSSDEGDGN